MTEKKYFKLKTKLVICLKLGSKVKLFLPHPNSPASDYENNIIPLKKRSYFNSLVSFYYFIILLNFIISVSIL